MTGGGGRASTPAPWDGGWGLAGRAALATCAVAWVIGVDTLTGRHVAAPAPTVRPGDAAAFEEAFALPPPRVLPLAADVEAPAGAEGYPAFASWPRSWRLLAASGVWPAPPSAPAGADATRSDSSLQPAGGRLAGAAPPAPVPGRPVAAAPVVPPGQEPAPAPDTPPSDRPPPQPGRGSDDGAEPGDGAGSGPQPGPQPGDVPAESPACAHQPAQPGSGPPPPDETTPAQPGSGPPPPNETAPAQPGPDAPPANDSEPARQGSARDAPPAGQPRRAEPEPPEGQPAQPGPEPAPVPAPEPAPVPASEPAPGPASEPAPGPAQETAPQDPSAEAGEADAAGTSSQGTDLGLVLAEAVRLERSRPAYPEGVAPAGWDEATRLGVWWALTEACAVTDDDDAGCALTVRDLFGRLPLPLPDPVRWSGALSEGRDHGYRVGLAALGRPDEAVVQSAAPAVLPEWASAAPVGG